MTTDSSEIAERVFDKLKGFAAYGFPKAHAAAFAVLAYQSCWLKRYRPAEFACALLNNQPMGFYAPHVIVNDATRHGLRVFGPDVNASRVRCSVAHGAIRIGLDYTKRLSASRTCVRASFVGSVIAFGRPPVPPRSSTKWGRRVGIR